MTCAPGWTKTPSNYACVKILKNPRKSWYDARRACQSAGGDLVTIYDEIMSKFIKDQVVAKNIDYAWTGLRHKRGGDKWVWLDDNGTPNYTHWRINPKQSTYFQGTNKCAGVAQTKGMAAGYYSRSCSSHMAYICEKPTGYSCNPGWTKPADGAACYKIYYKQEKTWYDARRECQNAGGDLVTIYHRKVSNSIKELFGDNIINPTWIGLRNFRSDERWHWLDEDGNLTYADWLVEPKSPFLGIYKKECGYVERRFPFEQRWYASGCSKALRYICEKPLAFPCYDGWMKTPSGEACVKVFGERAPLRRPWLDARRRCQKLGGDLVTIRDTTMSHFIRDLLIGKDSFPSWIGFHKLTGEDRWHWLDEDRTPKYTNWGDPVEVPWGRNLTKEKCAGVIKSNKQGATWYTYDCSHDLRYICEMAPPPSEN
ncbi:macrophage mannose receptor 1 [Plakobranchus ocellatus]|uniref:Macrophage mannose receptor 1 n=1 Tax=Plakobranchus ocellatus TaxID=259542 RepID=A0AAV4CTG5_9GAST|nr:macrophage mannose receptor 1 [Plakobranchus ocellatus]